MPPKKKAGAKKKAGKKAGSSKGPTVIDGLPVSEMSKEQLEGHVKRLQEEVRIFVSGLKTVFFGFHLYVKTADEYFYDK
jgi:hypothetical protein